jgi:hypothetical protein
MMRVVGRILVLGLISATGFVHGQLYLGSGFQAGYNSMPNSDVAIDRYNGRAFLYRPMNRFHWPMGEIHQVSLRFGRGMVLLNLNTRRQRATAKSFNSSTNGLDQTDWRFAMQALSFGGGYAIVDKEKFVMYLGVALDAGYMRLLNRSGPENQIHRIDYSLVQRLPMFAGSTFLKIFFRDSHEDITTWSIAPYVHVPFQEFDFQFFDQMLNGSTPGIPAIAGPLPDKPLNVGLSVNFDLDILGFLNE